MNRHVHLLAVLILLPTCSCSSGARSTGAWARLEAQRATLAALRPGTTEPEVLGLLGRPDEIKAPVGTRFEGEAYRWAYGSHRIGGFAHIGMVFFATNRTVIEAHCPTLPKYLPPAATNVPLSTKPQAASHGEYCLIDSVRDCANSEETSKRSPELRDFLSQTLKYRIVNGGTNAFDFKQPYPWIKFNLIVEVYDRRKKLILRQDYAHYGVASFRPNPADRPAIRIPPGGSVGEDFPLWLTDVYYGTPEPGRYFVRLLFPFENGRFYCSNLKEFTVQARLTR